MKILTLQPEHYRGNDVLTQGINSILQMASRSWKIILNNRTVRVRSLQTPSSSRQALSYAATEELESSGGTRKHMS